MRTHVFVPTAFGTLLVTAALAAQAPNSTVYSNTPGAPTNSAPVLGLPFDAGSGTSAAFYRPFVSSSGAHWAVRAELDQTGTVSTLTDGILILDGTTILVREGDPAPGLPAETVGTLTTGNYAINDSGEVLAPINLTTTTGDETVVLFDSMGVPTLLAREDDPIPGAPATYVYGDPMSAPILSDTGVIGFESSDTTTGEVITTGTTTGVTGLLLDDDVDSPMGLAPRIWSVFDFDDVRISPDGTTTLVQGDMDGSSSDDDILTANNVVIVQEDSVIPPFTANVSTIGGSAVDPLNNVYVYGSNDGGDDWLLRNGMVVAQSGDAVVSGSAISISTSGFQGVAGNIAGVFAFLCDTDASTDVDAMLLVDDGTGNRRILAREGDPVDVDNNGLFDDDRFINSFGTDDLALAPDRALVVIGLENGAGSSIENALISVPVAGPLARFTADATFSSTVPFTVNFDGSDSSSSAGPVTYAWDFDGDGATDSTLAAPSFTYNTPGFRTVTLTVDDGVSTSVASRVDLIEVENFTAAITATPTFGPAPLAVSFTDTSTGPIPPTMWEWDFESDGVVDSTAQNPMHVYPNGGSFTVTATFSNVNGSQTVVATNLITAVAPTENTESADILSFQFNEVRGSTVANTASTTAAPRSATVTGSGGARDDWQTGTGRFVFSPATEPGIGALRQDSSADYRIDTGWPVSLTGGYTIMWWQRIQTTSGSYYAFGTGSGNLRAFETGDDWSFRGSSAIGNFDTTSNVNGTTQTGIWNHIALVLDDVAGTATWYVNGVVDASAPLTGPIDEQEANLVINSLDVNSTSSFANGGDMDDFRLYGRALTQAEVATAMGGESPTSSTYGEGCAPSGAGIPTIRGSIAPKLGEMNFNVEVDGFAPMSIATLFVNLFTSNDPISGLLLPFDLTPIVPPIYDGCAMQIGLDFGESLGIMPTGSASRSFPVPNMPGFEGIHIYVQVLGISPSGGQVTPALDVNWQQ